MASHQVSLPDENYMGSCGVSAFERVMVYHAEIFDYEIYVRLLKDSHRKLHHKSGIASRT